jgi:hypothetical protein
VFDSANEYLSECRREAKWLDAGTPVGWTGCCDEMWLAVVVSEGVPLSWWQVLGSYRISLTVLR